MCDHNIKKNEGIVTVALAFLFLVLSFACGICGALIGRVAGVDVLLTSTASSAVGALAGIVVLGKSSLLRPNGQSARDMLRMGWWPLAISIVLFCLDLWGMLATGASLADDWPVRVCSIAVMCLFTGLAEESMFRGLVLQGLLAILGDGQKGVRFAALVSALIFGLLHIEWWSIDPANSLDMAQALLKTIQTGILGFYFAAVTIHTGSIVCPAIIHGVSNFFLMLCAFGLMGIPIELEYVSAGEDAWLTIILYVVIIALYAPMVYKGVRLLGKMQAPNRGAFIKAKSK